MCRRPGASRPGCTGLWNETQRDAWQRIVDFVHTHSAAKFSLQLGHSGRKGSTQLGWERADHPLPEGNWEVISASPLPYLRRHQPDAARHDCVRIWKRSPQQFVHAAQLGAQAGFDMLELHMAHGYLLASFLSPLTNRRDDEFGGDIAQSHALPTGGLQSGARRVARRRSPCRFASRPAIGLKVD